MILPANRLSSKNIAKYK